MKILNSPKDNQQTMNNQILILKQATINTII